jgi:transposase
MIPVAAGVRIWIASGHTDMRKGMNGLALLVQEGLGRDPFPELKPRPRSGRPRQ